MGLHPSDPLAEKVVSVRAQWNRLCIPCSVSHKKKKLVILYLSAVFKCFLQQCHRVLPKNRKQWNFQKMEQLPTYVLEEMHWQLFCIHVMTRLGQAVFG